MAAEFILSLDQGTTNTKALLVNRAGVPVFHATCPVGLLQPHAVWIEQDPLELWESVLKVIRSGTAEASRLGGKVAGVTISNQRETAVAWRREKRNKPAIPLCNAISWQCRRSSAICELVATKAAMLRSRTGLPLDPLITASKWAWMLENDAAVGLARSEENLCLGTVDSWLAYNLMGGVDHITDHSNASRTGLLNLERVAWDDELLQLFSIPKSALPELRSSAEHLGDCAIPELEGVPIVAILGDSHAAMAGHGNFHTGTVKATYGTGSSLMTLTSELPPDDPRLSRTIAWSVGKEVQYALEGNITMSGAAIQWVGEFLGLADPISSTVALSETVPDAGGVVLVPAMAGLGAPYWNTDARGTLCNLGRSHTAAHLARAAVDAIAHQVADVYEVMEEIAHTKLSVLKADGGATRNARLMQLQADLIDRPVLRASLAELSALGVGRLGGLTLGWWSALSESASGIDAGTSFEPAMSSKARTSLRRTWSIAVERACMATSEGAP